MSGFLEVEPACASEYPVSARRSMKGNSHG